MNTKPRSDAKLRSLPSAQKDILRGWLVDQNLSYQEARSRLEAELGVKTSLGALSDFYATDCFSLRYRDAETFAAQVKDTLAKAPEVFDQATLGAISQKAFELAVAKGASVKDLTLLSMIIGDAKKVALKEKELALKQGQLELKVRQYEEKSLAMRASLEKAKTKGGLDPATLQLIEEQLKLL